ncbi:MAG: Sialic acid TRAP transporter permease protein SiaT [Smithella sp. PtaU1.Bin162]|nr:MAG: Sialic acid TRAP transporter permease protein SiaT [Smithella sp. PtaU1.Bin162]
MEHLILALPLIGMIILIAIGMPVAFAMGVAGAIGIFFMGGFGSLMGILGTSPYRTAASYTLTTVPLFILMAQLIVKSEIVHDIFEAGYKWLGHLPGGVAIATVMADAGFGAMCGSSTAAAAAMSSVAIPQMKRLKYKDSLSGGVVAVAGTLAIMIPPSIVFIIYGSVTETSIGKLLIAGIIPGIMTALAYAVAIYLWVKIDPSVSPSQQAWSWKEKVSSLKGVWPMFVLFIVVIGTIYMGVATPTESAAFGATVALIMGLAMRRLDKDRIFAACLATIQSTVMIFVLIIGAMIFGYYITMTQLPQNFVKLIAASSIDRWVIMGGLVLFYILLGCILDQIAILLLTLPITFPLIMSLGFDPIWFGVMITALAEIGLITPPVGLNCFIVSQVSKLPLEEVFKGTSILLISEVVIIVLLMCFPEITLWLPSMMN